MNLLAICSALDNSYIAIKYDGKILSKIIKSDKNYHSLYIISEIKKIIENNNIKLENLDAITVNCGPGSFTGIRVALTNAKVLAGELDKPLIPLNTAEILLKAYDCDYLLMDARRDMFYFGNQEKIELIYKDKINDELTKKESKKIIADKKCSQIFKNTICFEEKENDLGTVMLDLAEEKFEKADDKKIFNHFQVSANYIQTPPINQ